VADPGASYRRFASEIDAAVRSVLESGWYILGDACRQFEQAFATFCSAPHAMGVANGTDAVELALRAVGVGMGDHVVTVANTAVATVSAIERIGAIPVFADVDEATQTLSPASFARLVAHPLAPIKAVVVVHLFGQPADLDALLPTAERAGIDVIEDCAQAHGAEIHGAKVGTLGAAGAFSFYPTKNLGAFGDGGAVVTNRAEVADRVRLLRQYGWRERYHSEVPGLNSRLDELQAAILSVKLPWLTADNARRRAVAARYCDALRRLPIILPTERDGAAAVYHQFVVRSPQRDALARHLADDGIGTAILYPVPIHRQTAYTERYGNLSLPVTERLSETLLCLPIYPELSDEQVDYVCASVRRFFNAKVS
jgi:dTDP-4-amino-4,6-dideoxygalactose transaminase